MSNIGSKDNSLGKKYDLVIANGTEDVFQSLIDDNKKLNIFNKVIISIPTNSETGEDEIGAASVWMTDSNGKLYQLTKPINKINTNVDNIENNINIDEIKNTIISDVTTAMLQKINSLGTEQLQDDFRSVLEEEKNKVINDVANDIGESIKQTFGINKNIEKEVLSATEKINSINKKLNEDINKIIWNNPNISYLSHVVRQLASKFKDITYEYDTEFSDPEILHREHSDLFEKINALEQRLDELQNNGH